MLNFKKWFESFIDHEPTIKDALNVFFKPSDTGEQISAASIIDAEITKSHVPFIYLGDTDDVYEGSGNDYHDNIIDSEFDDNLRRKLSDAYNEITKTSTSHRNNAVGRIGYRIDFDKLKRYLARENLMLLMQGEETGDEVEKSNRMRNFNIKIDSHTPMELQRLFNSIDLISFYRNNCGIEIAARSVELLNEKNSINDLNKTIVIFNEKPYLASEFITHARKQEPDVQQEPILTQKQSRELSRRFIPKPETMRQAAYMAGIPMGDSVINRGKKYHG